MTRSAADTTLPLVERIALAIAAKLATINRSVLDPTTSLPVYNNDVSQVVRPRRSGGGYTPQDRGICLLQGDADVVDTLTGNPPILVVEQTFSLDLVVSVSEADEDPVDTVVNLFATDINRAMMADTQWTVEGTALANLTRLAGVSYPAPASGLEGITLIYVVQFQVTETDWSRRV